MKKAKIILTIINHIHGEKHEINESISKADLEYLFEQLINKLT